MASQEFNQTALLPLAGAYFALTLPEPSQPMGRNLHQGTWLYFFHFPV
jgi:hypothetical protein